MVRAPTLSLYLILKPSHDPINSLTPPRMACKTLDHALRKRLLTWELELFR